MIAWLLLLFCSIKSDALLKSLDRVFSRLNFPGYAANPDMNAIRQRFSGLRARVKVEDVLKSPKWPDKWPFSPQDFGRQDESLDVNFYDQPRLLYHIDDAAVNALTEYYKTVIPDGADVLDIASSWVSHYPKDKKLGKVTGLGMNGLELSKNVQLTVRQTHRVFFRCLL